MSPGRPSHLHALVGVRLVSTPDFPLTRLHASKAVALEAQVDEGDTVDVSVKNGAIVIRPSRPTYSLEQLVAKITPRNRHHESDWGTLERFRFSCSHAVAAMPNVVRTLVGQEEPEGGRHQLADVVER